MNIVRHNPYQVRKQNNNLDSWFDGVFDDFFGPALPIARTSPKAAQRRMQVDIYEKNDVLIVEAELAGVAKEDLKLDVKGKELTIGGERKHEEEVNEENLYRRERTYGVVERTFSLPFEIDAGQVTAKFENGILKLEIPKPEEKRSKRIEIS